MQTPLWALPLVFVAPGIPHIVAVLGRQFLLQRFQLGAKMFGLSASIRPATLHSPVLRGPHAAADEECHDEHPNRSQ
ncbi:MAG: hypothetical protein KDI71_22325, partial [Xanthomonadales bacterium]|nr:hypothetical protein [Xanthomonadales bacterium]